MGSSRKSKKDSLWKCSQISNNLQVLCYAICPKSLRNANKRLKMANRKSMAVNQRIKKSVVRLQLLWENNKDPANESCPSIRTILDQIRVSKFKLQIIGRRVPLLVQQIWWWCQRLDLDSTSRLPISIIWLQVKLQKEVGNNEELVAWWIRKASQVNKISKSINLWTQIVSKWDPIFLRMATLWAPKTMAVISIVVWISSAKCSLPWSKTLRRMTKRRAI